MWRHRLKRVGVFVALCGILATLANLRGCFLDAERIAFAQRIMMAQDEVPRSECGFDEFLAAFPPPQGISPSEVTGIADKVLRYNSRSDVGSSVAYLVNGERTDPIALFDEIQLWARSSIYGWISLGITALGWVLFASIEFTQPRGAPRGS